MSPLYCALVHYPVRNREGQRVTTAVTNLDVHDLARLARTYALRGYFVVTPIEAQRVLVGRIMEHWRSGPGKARLPERSEALQLVRTVASIEEACAEVLARERAQPRLVATAARARGDAAVSSYAEERRHLRQTDVPTLLLFGTGHGLDASVIEESDLVLPPIDGLDGYNHLSVRAAAAIVLDRLLGARE